MVMMTKPDDVRNHNRGRVLAAVRRSGVASRTEISQTTGLSAATVSAITSDFLQEGVLLPPAEASVTATGRGRPKVSLVVNPDAAMVCAVYVQLNFISAAMIDYSGATICDHTNRLATRTITAAEIKSEMIACVEAALKQSGRDSSKLRRIEVAFQGVTDVDGTRVLWTPICEERDIPIAAWLEDHFAVPTQVANDCDMIAQALNWREPDKYGENFAAVLLAHGVGMGLFLRNEIVNGTSSSGVEFGHMTYVPNGALCRCGNFGCIEAYAGDYAISRSANGQVETAPPSGPLDPPDLNAIAEAARAGSSKALAAINAAGAAIGTGIASLYAIVDAFPVVIVGRGAAIFDLMEQNVRAALDTAPGENRFKSVEIDCYPDEKPLVREGCAITALLVQDGEMSNRRIQTETET